MRLEHKATLNFNNSSLMNRRCLPMKVHEGFQVKVAGGTLLSCTHLVPQLSIPMAKHTVTYDFFIVNLDDMEVIMGIQLRETLNGYTQSFKWMGFFFEVDCKKVVLRGMENDGPKEISTRHMEAIFGHDDVS